jgi:hypothetical protein
MPLGATSLARLSTCRPELQTLMKEVAQGIDEGDLAYAGIHDCTILCGHRGKAEQDKAYFVDHTSKKQWPESAHNTLPSDAVDGAFYPIDWHDRVKWAAFHAYVAGVAHAQGIDLHDISWDSPHFEYRSG